MDTLRTIIENARKNGVLVVKTESEILSNPSIEVVAELFKKFLNIKFSKVLTPESGKTLRYIQEQHIRGKSVHVDLRWTFGDGRVSGVTIACPFGSPSSREFEKIINAESKGVLGKTPSKQDWSEIRPKVRLQIRDKIQKKVDSDFFNAPFIEKYRPGFLNWGRKHVFVPKAMQDMSWFEAPLLVIPPGFVGAQKYEWAVLSPFDSGDIEFGVIKPDYTEFYIFSDNNFYNGKVVLIFLSKEAITGDLPDTSDEVKLGDELWVGFMFTTKNQTPYMLSERCIDEDFIPPVGVPGLPRSIIDLIPNELRYWETGDKNIRDKAVKWAEKNINFYTREAADDVPRRDQLWQL